MGVGMRKAGGNPATGGRGFRGEPGAVLSRPLLYAHERGLRRESGSLAAYAAEKAGVRAQAACRRKCASQKTYCTRSRARRDGCTRMLHAATSAFGHGFAAVFITWATGSPGIGGMYA